MVWQGQIRQLGQSQGMVQYLQLATIRCAADARNIFLFLFGQIFVQNDHVFASICISMISHGSDEPNRNLACGRNTRDGLFGLLYFC
jgi:hypothetical protein